MYMRTLRTMKKEIDQRNDYRVTIPCNCGGDHYLTFDFWDWKDENFIECSVAIVDPPGDFWYRVKRALQYIFKDGTLYHMDVGITSKDMDNITGLFKKYKECLSHDKKTEDDPWKEEQKNRISVYRKAFRRFMGFAQVAGESNEAKDQQETKDESSN